MMAAGTRLIQKPMKGMKPHTNANMAHNPAPGTPKRSRRARLSTATMAPKMVAITIKERDSRTEFDRAWT